MRLKAYAKINLSLDLTGILPDGYHAIDTVMQSVSLCDILTVEAARDIGLVCSAPGVPADSRNTAYRAAEYFFEKAGIHGGASILIEKHIPSQAGLGGGSADAAAVLYALNKIYPGAVAENDLMSLAVRVGADVPFCLTGGTRLCLGKGEIMTALPHFGAYALLVKPDAGVSTAEAFSRFDKAADLLHPDNAAVLECYKHSDGRSAAGYSLNIFEQLVTLPEGEKIKTALISAGAYHASMSGSGSCFFGLFDDEKKCLSAADALAETAPFVYPCRTVKTGVEIMRE